MDPVDVAVIGSGIAGLFLAVKCAKAGLKVAVITKKEISTSSTNWAQGGIAGVLDTDNKEGSRNACQRYLGMRRRVLQ
ncbi:MAG: FAD-dependent oxidoreductase [Candidatus Thalassarchaeaceae archaeon]